MKVDQVDHLNKKAINLLDDRATFYFLHCWQIRRSASATYRMRAQNVKISTSSLSLSISSKKTTKVEVRMSSQRFELDRF